jgi:hypothetical protein
MGNSCGGGGAEVGDEDLNDIQDQPSGNTPQETDPRPQGEWPPFNIPR